MQHRSIVVLGLLLASVLWTWAGAPPDVYIIEPGPFETPSQPIAAIAGGKQAKLCLSFEGFDDPAQRFSYRWEVSEDHGETWHEWFTASIVGGVHYDKQGNPLTQFCTVAPPRIQGPGVYHLIGMLQSPTEITVTVSIAERT